jgi:hypothetical protein
MKASGSKNAQLYGIRCTDAHTEREAEGEGGRERQVNKEEECECKKEK